MNPSKYLCSTASESWNSRALKGKVKNETQKGKEGKKITQEFGDIDLGLTW